MIDLLFVQLQKVLPHHAISRFAGKIADCRCPILKNALIRSFIRLYGVDLSEAISPDLEDYATFNEFFTRRLREGARPLSRDPRAVISPVDGKISQLGELLGDRWLIQAKGIDYSVETLLADERLAKDFYGGAFATLYLSPRDYHRVHMPVSGQLREMIHIPGWLFGVGEWTTENLPGLFTRNERVVMLFETEAGPMALAMVGAMVVGSIATVWHGIVTPPTGREVRRWRYPETSEYRFERGAELGHFRVGGSTVIVLFGRDRLIFKRQEGEPIRMGELLGQWHA